MNINRIKYGMGVTILAITVFIVACSKKSGTDNGPKADGFDKAGMLTNYADNLIIPAYMGLQDQITQLTASVATLTTAVTTLQAAIDAEQQQIAAALALLTADNPDVAAAIAGLQAASDALGAATADVASTIPDAPTG